MPKPKPDPTSTPTPTSPPTRDEIKAADKVVRKLTGTNFPDKTKVALLPAIADIFKTDAEVHDCLEVLERGHQLKDQIGELEIELKDVKMSATSIAMGAEVEGFRFGNLGVLVNLTPGRSSLNKDLLRSNMVDAGVDPTLVSQIIEDSHVTGEPYYTVRFEKVK